MLNKFKKLWSSLRSSLWFVPTLMVVTSIILAIILIEFDSRAERDWLIKYPRIFGAGSDGSRGMLTAIAGSMITVAGLSFSLTLVAMAQASSQYTSRILRNFMRDPRNQFVLGFFVSVFAYCLVVLRTIRGGDEGRFIPSFAVLFGLILAIASIGVLIFFIHHIAGLIQASAIIAAAAEETIESIVRLFPDELAEEASQAEEDQMSFELENNVWKTMNSADTGYIQSIDYEGLVDFAENNGGVLRMELGIGEFAIKGTPLVSFKGEGGIVFSDESKLTNLYSISKFRTITDDSAFGIRQIVDVALKALSPGVNDSTTAIVCIDYLCAIISELANRGVGSHYRSKSGKVRIIARGPTFDSLTDAAFEQIRDTANDNSVVYLKLLSAMQIISFQTKSRKRLEILSEHIKLIDKEAEIHLQSEFNRLRVKKRVSEVKNIVKSVV